MSRYWLGFVSSWVGFGTVLLLAGCGMRTLELVDEHTSEVKPLPDEAAVPDVSDTDTTVVVSSATQSTGAGASVPNNTSSVVQPPPMSEDDGGSSFLDAGARCPLERPYFDQFTGNCMECQWDPHCTRPGEICWIGGDCRPPCKFDNECPFDFVCTDGRCLECRTNLDCDERYNGSRPVCDQYSKMCREECTQPFHCTIEEPVCDVISRTCRTCMRDSECPQEAPVCGNFGRCIVPQNSTEED